MCVCVGVGVGGGIAIAVGLLAVLCFVSFVEVEKAMLAKGELMLLRELCNTRPDAPVGTVVEGGGGGGGNGGGGGVPGGVVWWW